MQREAGNKRARDKGQREEELDENREREREQWAQEKAEMERQREDLHRKLEQQRQDAISQPREVSFPPRLAKHHGARRFHQDSLNGDDAPGINNRRSVRQATRAARNRGFDDS